MKSDDRTKKESSDREKLLEEIRRRAEEAELRRIEDAEQDNKVPPSQRGPGGLKKPPPPSQKGPPGAAPDAPPRGVEPPSKIGSTGEAKAVDAPARKPAPPSSSTPQKPSTDGTLPPVQGDSLEGQAQKISAESDVPPPEKPTAPSPQVTKGGPEVPPTQKAPVASPTTPPTEKAPAVPQKPTTILSEVPPTQKAPVAPQKPATGVPETPPTQKGPEILRKATVGGEEVPPTQRKPADQIPVSQPNSEKQTLGREQPPAGAPFPAPFPVPSTDGVTSPLKPAREQRVTVLRERLVIALDRGKIQKAGELLSELQTLLDDQTELEGYRLRHQELQKRKEAGKEKKALPPAPPESKRKEPPPEDRAQRDARKKRIAELLDSADSLYQSEKYERSLQPINEILEFEPTHEEAIRMRGAIQKAQELAFRIQQEETRRKAEEAANFKAPPPTPELPKGRVTEKDVWGASTSPIADVGYELPPEEKGPVGPPKQPALEAFIDRLAKIKVPVKPLLIVGGLIFVGIVGYVVYDGIRNAVVPAKYSLLILPATPLINDTGFAWIADGITEDLIRDFTAVNELRVIGAGTALGFRSSAASPAQIARSVGANYYLQWSILRAPDGVVVQPSFYDTMGTRAIWVSRYETSMRELPSVRLELVHQLASVMKVTIGTEEEEAFRRYKVPTPEAYDLYLHARSMLRLPEKYEPGRVIEELERSTALDSSFADAYSALGWAHIVAYENAPEVIPSHLSQASVCVQRAIELGARNAETFRVWGLVEGYRGQAEKAVEHLGQAVSVSPTDAESQRRLAIAEVFKNDSEAGLRAATRAMTDDPGNVDSYTTLGLVQQFRAEYEEARKTYEQGMRFARDRSEYASGFYSDVLVYVQQPEHAAEILNDHLARARDNPTDYYKLGRIDQSEGKPKQEWQAELMKARALLMQKTSGEPKDAVALSFLALVHTRLGEFKEAHSANSLAQELAPNNIKILYNTARMFALQRDKNQALDYLTKAVNRRYDLPAILDMDFFNLRSEPEFLPAITR